MGVGGGGGRELSFRCCLICFTSIKIKKKKLFYGDVIFLQAETQT